MKRVVAGILDAFIIGMVWLVLTRKLNGFTSMSKVTDVGSSQVATLIYLGIVTVVYYFPLEGLFATTFGKFVLKLRVVGEDGDPCTLSSSLKRNILRLVDWLPFLYAIGVIAVLSSADRQRVGDRVAATVVTNVPEKDINPPPAPFLFH